MEAFLKPLQPDEEANWEIIQRMLYIYCKLCNQKYVQGMHEIITPIYYVMLTQPDSSLQKYCEVDTFFCFNQLMIELHSNYFIREMVDTYGIGLQIKQFDALLKHFDLQLHSHLQKLQLEHYYYIFRWISLLLSQEFSLLNTIRLWDFVFADDQRFRLVLFVCVAMLM
ncbi:hypothetical protein Ciccas_012081 [Cichlidogyrus casuarinus]|uniref:Rab-GAP TBC domain-containing protein n=1 Tax=Cichlidogyrus casuarinus TaxID=1844966 RepID=A0ABD2PPG8_9PLAT